MGKINFNDNIQNNIILTCIPYNQLLMRYFTLFS